MAFGRPFLTVLCTDDDMPEALTAP